MQSDLGIKHSCKPFAHGQYAKVRGITGAWIWTTGRIAAAGDSQAGKYVMRRYTSNATPATLNTGTGSSVTSSATNQIAPPNNSTYAFSGLLTARKTASGDSSAWSFNGLIKRGANAAATALVASVTPTLIAQDSALSSLAVSVTADTTNGCLKIEVTGLSSTDIYWVANVDTCEATN